MNYGAKRYLEHINKIIRKFLMFLHAVFDCSPQGAVVLTGQHQQPSLFVSEEKAGRARSSAVPGRSGTSKCFVALPALPHLL
jgi:hypothetical protein